jgi:hypothetical protein
MDEWERIEKEQIKKSKGSRNEDDSDDESDFQFTSSIWGKNDHRKADFGKDIVSHLYGILKGT